MMRYIIITVSLLFIFSAIAAGEGPKISENGNKHNFSSSNTGVNFKAADTDPRGRQVCIFCHTPHHASSEGPLWNRNAPTTTTFKNFSSSTLAIDNIGTAAYGQPTGSSRLCLSCHDGQTAIGAVFTAPGNNIPMLGDKDKIGYETYSSHHPVSFKYDDGVRSLLNNPLTFNKNLHYIQPALNEVKLDKDKQMQCTTCHDPHQNKATDPDNPTTPFWSTTTYENACLSCHNYGAGPPGNYPYPWKP